MFLLKKLLYQNNRNKRNTVFISLKICGSSVRKREGTHEWVWMHRRAWIQTKRAELDNKQKWVEVGNWWQVFVCVPGEVRSGQVSSLWDHPSSKSSRVDWLGLGGTRYSMQVPSKRHHTCVPLYYYFTFIVTLHSSCRTEPSQHLSSKLSFSFK